MSNAPSQQIENQLLAALPDQEYERLLPHLELVYLPYQQILYNPGELLRYVHFPYQALFSLTVLMENGTTVEVSVVGKEGMIGLPICWGSKTTSHQIMVQIPGNAMRMEAELLKAEFNRGGILQSRLLLYTQALLSQVSQTAACNRLHNIEERFSRWLLTVHDRMQSDELPLTQEFIANMLGIRRASVTEAAGQLQRAGLLRYSRGRITILDRESLESTACECYGLIKREFTRLLGDS